MPVINPILRKLRSTVMAVRQGERNDQYQIFCPIRVHKLKLKTKSINLYLKFHIMYLILFFIFAYIKTLNSEYIYHIK